MGPYAMGAGFTSHYSRHAYQTALDDQPSREGHDARDWELK